VKARTIISTAVVLALSPLSGCSRSKAPSADAVQRDATQGRFDRIDRAINEGQAYERLNVIAGLAKVRSEMAVDRLLLLANTADPGIRLYILDHAALLPKVQRQRVLGYRWCSTNKLLSARRPNALPAGSRRAVAMAVVAVGLRRTDAREPRCTRDGEELEPACLRRKPMR
jgi:hypothetical protein